LVADFYWFSTGDAGSEAGLVRRSPMTLSVSESLFCGFYAPGDKKSFVVPRGQNISTCRGPWDRRSPHGLFLSLFFSVKTLPQTPGGTGPGANGNSQSPQCLVTPPYGNFLPLFPVLDRFLRTLMVNHGSPGSPCPASP